MSENIVKIDVDSVLINHSFNCGCTTITAVLFLLVKGCG